MHLEVLPIRVEHWRKIDVVISKSKQIRCSCPMFSVAYKYNLLLLLKILSYTLYNSSIDEMQAVAAVARNTMSPRNRQATFSLYTIIIMKLKNN